MPNALIPILSRRMMYWSFDQHLFRELVHPSVSFSTMISIPGIGSLLSAVAVLEEVFSMIMSIPGIGSPLPRMPIPLTPDVQIESNAIIAETNKC